VDTTWWRTHPVGRRLVAVGAGELVVTAVTGPGPVDLLWLALTLWLLHRVRRSSGIAWAVLLAVSVITVALAVLALVAGAGTVWVPVVAAVVAAVVGAAQVALLLTPAVRGWVARSGLMSLPGEH